MGEDRSGVGGFEEKQVVFGRIGGLIVIFVFVPVTGKFIVIIFGIGVVIIALFAVFRVIILGGDRSRLVLLFLLICACRRRLSGRRGALHSAARDAVLIVVVIGAGVIKVIHNASEDDDGHRSAARRRSTASSRKGVGCVEAFTNARPRRRLSAAARVRWAVFAGDGGVEACDGKFARRDDLQEDVSVGRRTAVGGGLMFEGSPTASSGGVGGPRRRCC